MNTAKVKLYLDIRREKQGSKYPVKIRVWDPISCKSKLYPTGIDLTEREFEAVWLTTKPRKENQPLRDQLEAMRLKAIDIAKEKDTPIKELDRKLGRPKGEGQNVFWYYREAIEIAQREGRISTATGYQLAAKALKEFHGLRVKNPDKLTFATVGIDWLKAFETYMTRTGRSLTTIGIYLRTLRTMFNNAMEQGEVSPDQYPFGRKRYVIPAPRKVKKALSQDQLGALYKAKAATPEQQRAKDFFYFSYASNGMNIKDIALLKWQQLEADRFTFYRAKVKTTNREPQAITVYLTDFHREMIERYGNSPEASAYVFPIIHKGMNPTQERAAVQAFTRYINQHLKKLCKANGLPAEVSTYWARHSFATVGIRSGQSMEFMREALGHTDMKTTVGYFAGFEDDRKREFANQLMNF